MSLRSRGRGVAGAAGRYAGPAGRTDGFAGRTDGWKGKGGVNQVQGMRAEEDVEDGHALRSCPGQQQAQDPDPQDDEEPLPRHLREQNQIFWETARRKDDSLFAAQRECEVLAEELEAGCARAEKFEARALEAERGFEKVREDLRSRGREAGERVRRHAEDMEALSDTLCLAQSRFQEAESALKAARRQAEASNSEIKELSRDPREDLHAAIAREGQLKMLLEEGALSAAASEAQLRAELAVEASRAEAAAAEVTVASEEAAKGASELAAALTEGELLEAEVSEARRQTRSLEALLALKASEASAAAHTAFASECEHRALQEALAAGLSEVQASECAVFTEQAALKIAKDGREGALDEARAERARAERFNARLTEAAEELRREQLHRESGERVAAGAAMMLEAAQQRAVESEEGRVQAERLFVAEKLSAKRDETAAIESEASAARKAIGQQAIAEAAAKRALVEANKQLDVLTSDYGNLEASLARQLAELEAARHEEEASRAMLEESEEAFCAESCSASARLEAMVAVEHEASRRAAEELQSAFLATELAEGRSESRAAELCEEAVVQASLRKQASNAKAQAQRLHEAAELHTEMDEEREREFAKIREDATRHARFNTELRAELADTKRELSKCRHAARSLSQVSDELEQALGKLTQAQKGRGALEAEVHAGRNKQAALERHLRELETKVGVGERGIRHAADFHAVSATSCFEPSSAPTRADSWLCDPGGGLFGGSSSGLGVVAVERSSPTLFAATAAASCTARSGSSCGSNRGKSVDVNPNDDLIASESFAATAAPAIGRSSSMGAMPPGRGGDYPAAVASEGLFNVAGSDSARGGGSFGRPPASKSGVLARTLGPVTPNNQQQQQQQLARTLGPVTPPSGASASHCFGPRPPAPPGSLQGLAAANFRRSGSFSESLMHINSSNNNNSNNTPTNNPSNLNNNNTPNNSNPNNSNPTSPSTNNTNIPNNNPNNSPNKQESRPSSRGAGGGGSPSSRHEAFMASSAKVSDLHNLHDLHGSSAIDKVMR
ncbi:unnamed protein product, partial [Polarella glacialis]